MAVAGYERRAENELVDEKARVPRRVAPALKHRAESMRRTASFAAIVEMSSSG